MLRVVYLTYSLIFVCSCETTSKNLISKKAILKDTLLTYQNYTPNDSDIIISRDEYTNKLYGFWLGQCIANWTGLVTEMDKIGNIGEFKTGDFYTMDDWGKPDQSSIWGQGIPSDLSATIDFVFRDTSEIWGADDDTDIEYIYQHLLYTNQTSILTGEQIKNGWLNHIKAEEENYLWVSNQRAFDLMKEGAIPPATSLPENNEHYEMIDAQLTTEIFGFYSPSRPDIARKLAQLPIQTTARKNAEWISLFYVTMYSLAANVNDTSELHLQIEKNAMLARNILPDSSYSAAMFDFVLNEFKKGTPWESTRDKLYQRYQVDQADGYDITSQHIYCNGCFAAGINFGSSIISLLYGRGNLKETIKIGALCGWDADNPTATWGGMLGFILGKEGIEKTFNRTFSNRFNIHRTRQNFPNNGIDTFEHMSEIGIYIVDRVVQEQLKGGIDLNKNIWYIPVQKKNHLIDKSNF